MKPYLINGQCYGFEAYPFQLHKNLAIRELHIAEAFIRNWLVEEVISDLLLTPV